jgi:hypothetical protein
MSRFTDPAKAGELICGSAWRDGPARGALDLVPEAETDQWWPQPGAEVREAELEAGG